MHLFSPSMFDMSDFFHNNLASIMDKMKRTSAHEDRNNGGGYNSGKSSISLSAYQKCAGC